MRKKLPRRRLVRGLIAICGVTFAAGRPDPIQAGQPPIAGSMLSDESLTETESTSAALEPTAEPLGASPRALYLRTGTVDLAGKPSLLTASTKADRGRHYVLQLDGPITPQRRDRLEAAGVVLGPYLPMHAYVCRIGNADLEALRRFDFITWLGAYEDAWKIGPEHGQTAFKTPMRRQIEAAGDTLLTVHLFDDTDAASVQAALRPRGARVLPRAPHAGSRKLDVRIPRRQVQSLRSLKEVMFVEEAPEAEPRNPSTSWIVQSNVENFRPLWDAGLHGEGQIAGIIDWGMRADHCAFHDEFNPIGPLHRKILAYYGAVPNPNYAYHGTHVAGVVAADELADTNPALKGMAYEAKVVFQHYDGVLEGGTLNAMNRLTIAHDDGARVHNNSWGNNDFFYNTWARDIDLFTRTYEDDLVLVAVINNGRVKAPENAKNCLAVSGAADAPEQEFRCTGGYGPTADGRQKPEVLGIACGSQSADYYNQCGNDDTGGSGGTSYATPAVAGMGMLARQYFMEGFYPSGAANPSDAFTPSGALLKAIVINSAVDMTGLSGYFGIYEGWGRVLMGDALYFAGDTRKVVLHDVRNASGLNTGERTSYFVRVDSAAQPLKITLVWTDVPAAVAASYAPVNDIDLVVTEPGGDVYLGNVFSGNESAPGGIADPRNNAEQVHRNAPLTGIWKIEILGTAVQQDRQGYALVATGDVTEVSGECFNADLDLDGDLDGDDYMMFLDAFGQSQDDPGYNDAADFDDDGTVTFIDYQVWLRCYYEFIGGAVSGPPAPRPRGDFNGDYLLDGRDIQGFVDLLMATSKSPLKERILADIDQDYHIRAADISRFVERLAAGM